MRIIGGRWRRRKLQFPPIEGLRPTPDRIRETVFNWLTPYLTGAQVLDAYCGSGALGLESLSRGARYGVFVDQSKDVEQQLAANLQQLECQNAEIHRADFLNWLAHSTQCFDVVFLDPPYNSALLQPSIDALTSSPCVTADTLLYLEHPADSKPLLTSNWAVVKELGAGSNLYRLLRFQEA